MALKTEEWVALYSLVVIEMTTETQPHLMQMRKPKARTSHQSQAFSVRTRSVDLFTIRVHLASDNPKPANAPYLLIKYIGKWLELGDFN